METIEMPFSADLSEIDLPQEGENQIIVSDQVPLKVGDALPLKLKDGRSMNGVVVSTYSSRVPYLSFTRGSSATSFSSLLNMEPRILFWRDGNGLIEAQRDVYDPRPTGIGFLILMEKDIQPKTRKAVLSEIQKMQYYPQSLTEIARNSAEERLEILKKELVILVYMVIVSAIYILSSAFIDESRFGYRMAVYRLNGLSRKTQVFISTFPVFFSGVISLGVAFAVKAFLSRG